AAGRDVGLAVAEEAFADRRYEPDGALAPRSLDWAVLHDPAAAAEQARGIVCDGSVLATGGARVSLRADTLCVHGDTEGATAIARAVRARLESAGAIVAPLAQGAGST